MLFNQLQNRLSNMIGCTVFNKVKKLPRKIKISYILKHQFFLKQTDVVLTCDEARNMVAINRRETLGFEIT